MKLNQKILKEMILEVLEGEDEVSTRLGTTGISAAQFKTAGAASAKTVQDDKGVDKVELAYIKQVQDFLLNKARQTDLTKHKVSIQTLIQRLDKIIGPDAPEQGEPQ
jgi:hypothetical protein